MTFTSHIIKGLMSRLDLLLQVNIEPQGGVPYSRNWSVMDPSQQGRDIFNHFKSVCLSVEFRLVLLAQMVNCLCVSFFMLHS